MHLVHADSKLFQPRSFKSFPAKLIQQNIWAYLVNRKIESLAALFCDFWILSAGPISTVLVLRSNISWLLTNTRDMRHRSFRAPDHVL